MPKKSNQANSGGMPPKTAKEERLFQNLFKITQQFISGRGFVPLTESELIARLKLPEQHHFLFREILDTLERTGVVERKGNRYSLLQTKAEVVKGLLHMHPRGFGFVTPEDTTLYGQDIFIPKHLTQNAVDGDVVEVLVNNDVISDKGPEGKIVTILNRGRTHFAGIIRTSDRYGEILAYVPLLGMSQRVVVQPCAEKPLKVGDRIVMEVLDWGSKETETLCKMSHYLGHISDPGCDVKAAIEEYELRNIFPTQAVEEAQSYGKVVPQKEIKAREDFRDKVCFTIDPDTAKDFDDAVGVTKDKKGGFELTVHIADVSHYVKPGTALDNEAKLRCNSTYFPGTAIPMLPRELSDNLCSLKPDVNRLTVTVIMHFDNTGEMKDYRITRSVIKSAKRFTYKEAKLVLDGKKTSEHAPTLRLMVELCGLLKKKRYERGSLEFAMPELVIKVDENGVPVGTDYVAYDITHQLVEEFMLKANETVATHLNKIGKNLTYRVHDEPAEENMKDFSALASAFGFQISEKPTPAELQKLFDEAMDSPYGQYLATSYIRRMRLAMYSSDNIGHYGLGLTHYCHFTSPIRRYVDLVVHRILFGESDEKETLEMISSQCSEQERISAKAENNVVLLKKLRLLQSIQNASPHKEFEAVVTRVKNFGISFEVLELMLESFLHVSELENDYYVFEESSMRLRGTRSGGSYSSGDKITVLLKDVDLILLESKWNLVGDSERQDTSRTRRVERRGERGRRGEREGGSKGREGGSRERGRGESGPKGRGQREESRGGSKPSKDKDRKRDDRDRGHRRQPSTAERSTSQPMIAAIGTPLPPVRTAPGGRSARMPLKTSRPLPARARSVTAAKPPSKPAARKAHSAKRPASKPKKRST